MPECAILVSPEGLAPAFGSRLELTARQLPKKFDALTVAGTFGRHGAVLGQIYPLDAFLPNPDRHGRNMMLRPQLTGESLVSIDFSQAWSITGHPCGDLAALAPSSHTAQWWIFFRDNLKMKADFTALDKAAGLPDTWMTDTIAQTPPQWQAGIDLDAVNSFWQKERRARIDSAKIWA